MNTLVNIVVQPFNLERRCIMKILAAIDQSEYAILVLDKALELAAQSGAQVTALTVGNPAPVDFYLSEPPGVYLERMREDVQKTVDRAREQASAANMDVDVVVEESTSPADAIVRYAEKNGVNLIIVGNKGAGALERFFIGSVSSNVVTHSPCSVMVVKK
jgi:nucleotide-binding universal stress UspA family protein